MYEAYDDDDQSKAELLAKITRLNIKREELKEEIAQLRDLIVDKDSTCNKYEKLKKRFEKQNRENLWQKSTIQNLEIEISSLKERIRNLKKECQQLRIIEDEHKVWVANTGFSI